MFRFPAGWHFITVWCSLDLSVVTAVDLYKNCCCSFRISWFVLWSKSSSNVTVPPLCPAVQCRVENEIDKVVLTHHWNCHPLWRRNNPRIWHISDTEYLPRPGTLVGNTWRTNLPATETKFSCTCVQLPRTGVQLGWLFKTTARACLCGKKKT